MKAVYLSAQVKADLGTAPFPARACSAGESYVKYWLYSWDIQNKKET